jgi:hypothetical protein
VGIRELALTGGKISHKEIEIIQEACIGDLETVEESRQSITCSNFLIYFSYKLYQRYNLEPSLNPSHPPANKHLCKSDGLYRSTEYSSHECLLTFYIFYVY